MSTSGKKVKKILGIVITVLSSSLLVFVKKLIKKGRINRLLGIVVIVVLFIAASLGVYLSVDDDPDPVFAAGGDNIFNDTFTDTSGTDLDAHTPNTGTSWTQVYQTGGSSCSSDPDLDISGTNTLISECSDGTTAGTAYTADATYPSADYQVQYTAVNAGNSDEYLYGFIRGNGTLGEGYVVWDTTDATTDDAILSRITSTSACTQLDIVDEGEISTALWGDNTVVILQATGTEIVVFTDNRGYLYVRDGNIASTNEGGIGMGALPCATSGDLSTSAIEADNFSVVEVSTTASGWKDPSTTGENSNNWTNPTNAYTSNNSDAQAVAAADAQDFGDFGHSIPAGSTITGVEILVEAGVESDGDWEEMKCEVSLDNGSTWSSALTMRYQASADDTYLCGHANYLWGETWTVTDTADSDFRVRITLNDEQSGFGGRSLLVDHVQTRIWYDAAAGGGEEEDPARQNVIWIESE